MIENPTNVIKFTTYITLKDGRRIYAKSYGKKAFPIVVSSTPKRKSN